MLTEAGKNCKKLADLKCERSLNHSVHLFLVLFQVFVATFCYFCISFVPIQYSPNLGVKILEPKIITSLSLISQSLVQTQTSVKLKVRLNTTSKY